MSILQEITQVLESKTKSSTSDF